MKRVDHPPKITWARAGRVTGGKYFSDQEVSTRETVWFYRESGGNKDCYIASCVNFVSRRYPDLNTAVAATLLRLP